MTRCYRLLWMVVTLFCVTSIHAIDCESDALFFGRQLYYFDDCGELVPFDCTPIHERLRERGELQLTGFECNAVHTMYTAILLDHQSFNSLYSQIQSTLLHNPSPKIVRESFAVLYYYTEVFAFVLLEYAKEFTEQGECFALTEFYEFCGSSFTYESKSFLKSLRNAKKELIVLSFEIFGKNVVVTPFLDALEQYTECPTPIEL